MKRYYVSLRVYDDDSDFYGEEWKLTPADVISLRLYLENKYGKGSEL